LSKNDGVLASDQLADLRTDTDVTVRNIAERAVTERRFSAPLAKGAGASSVSWDELIRRNAGGLFIDTCGVNFGVRDAMTDDLPRLQVVFQRSSIWNEGDRAALVDHPEALVLSASSLSGGRMRVATVGPELIVGFATTVREPGFLELVDLFTDPDWMRRGVATTLVKDVVQFATAIGVARVSVIGNQHALDFYRRVGFVIEGHAATDFGQGLRMHLSTATKQVDDGRADDLGRRPSERLGDDRTDDPVAESEVM
jgi:GNAT superfamily N-acetyltransferase